MARRDLSRLASLVLVAALVAAPSVASGAAKGRPAKPPRMTATERIRVKGPTAARRLVTASTPATPPVTITGRVGHSGGMWEDADVLVLALQWEPEISDWMETGGSWVASDGAYEVELEAAGDYRLFYIDFANVYGEVFYKDAATVETADTVSVPATGSVAGIDQTLTPLPENIISGTIAFVGAAAPSGDIETDDYVSASAVRWNSKWGDWENASFGSVRSDGTYRLHLPEGGTYRVGFYDWSGVFEEVFYKDALTVEEATSVPVPDPAHSASGIDQTMTAIPSTRIGGEDRYETAVSASEYAFPDYGAHGVVIATGENWPDAVSGGVLAAGTGGPLLLTRRSKLPECVVEELMRLEPWQVVIVGGYAAVSLDVEIQLRTTFDIPMVWRLNGRDRYETAVLVAEMMMEDSSGAEPLSPARVAFERPLVVASGERFPDAVCAAPLAASSYAPLLLVRRGSVPDSVRGFLQRHGSAFTGTVVIGGPSAVSTPTASAFPSWRRVSGADRYETAAAAATFGCAALEMSDNTVGLASGAGFADGLVAGPVLASGGYPLLLTRPDRLSPAAERFMDDHGTSRVLIFGSENAVGADTFERVLEVVRP